MTVDIASLIVASGALIVSIIAVMLGYAKYNDDEKNNVRKTFKLWGRSFNKKFNAFLYNVYLALMHLKYLIIYASTWFFFIDWILEQFTVNQTLFMYLTTMFIFISLLIERRSMMKINKDLVDTTDKLTGLCDKLLENDKESTELFKDLINQSDDLKTRLTNLESKNSKSKKAGR